MWRRWWWAAKNGGSLCVTRLARSAPLRALLSKTVFCSPLRKSLPRRGTCLSVWPVFLSFPSPVLPSSSRLQLTSLSSLPSTSCDANALYTSKASFFSISVTDPHYLKFDQPLCLECLSESKGSFKLWGHCDHKMSLVQAASQAGGTNKPWAIVLNPKSCLHGLLQNNYNTFNNNTENQHSLQKQVSPVGYFALRKGYMPLLK